MKLGLINSAWAQAGRDTAYGIRMTREIGFDSIDIFADPLDIDARERRLIRRECSRVGLPIISVACVAVGLIDFNPSVQRFHLDRCRKYLDLCHELEARNLLLVLGEYIWERQVIPPAEQWRTGVANVKQLADHAAKLGLEIAIELEPFQLSLVRDVETMVRFLDEVGHPAVKAISPTATQATLTIGRPTRAHSWRMSRRSRASMSSGSAKMSIESNPISRVIRIP